MVPITVLYGALKDTSWMDFWRKVPTYRFHLGQVKTDKLTQEKIISTVGFDPYDLDEIKVRNMVGMFKPTLAANLTNFKTLMSKKETMDLLHDDDIPRLYKYFNMNAPCKDGKPVVTWEQILSYRDRDDSQPKTPTYKSFPYFMYGNKDVTEYTHTFALLHPRQDADFGRVIRCIQAAQENRQMNDELELVG